MKLPMHQECSCGHMGAKHRDDGSCARCECKKFSHPVHIYVRGDRSGIPRKSVGARAERNG